MAMNLHSTIWEILDRQWFASTSGRKKLKLHQMSMKMPENVVEAPEKIHPTFFDRFTKLGADALKEQMLTQYILERKTSKREMPRTHTAAAFFHCSRWVRLQVCRRGFPLLAEFPASCLRGLLHAGLPPAPAPCAAFAAAPSWLSFLQRCRFSFFFLDGGDSHCLKYSNSAGLPAAALQGCALLRTCGY